MKEMEYIYSKSELEKELAKLDTIDLNLSIKKYLLNEIFQKLQDDNIENCKIEFNLDILRKKQNIDNVCQIVSSKVEDLVYECMNDCLVLDDVVELDYNEELEK